MGETGEGLEWMMRWCDATRRDSWCRESLSASGDRDSFSVLYKLLQSAQFGTSAPANKRLLPKELKHLLSHPVSELVLHPRHNRHHLPSSPPDVQRLYERARRLPWHQLIVRTREHEHPLPHKGSAGCRDGIICANQRAQRRGNVWRRAGDTEARCALLHQSEIVGATAYWDADADPRFFNYSKERAVV